MDLSRPRRLRLVGIDVPPYIPERDALGRFEDEVIDRLFVLNEKRYEEEQVKGLGGGKKAKAQLQETQKEEGRKPARVRGWNMSRPITVFFSYSHKDEEFRNELEVHLAPLKRQEIVETWHDRRIGAGKEVHGGIGRNLRIRERGCDSSARQSLLHRVRLLLRQRGDPGPQARHRKEPQG